MAVEFWSAQTVVECESLKKLVAIVIEAISFLVRKSILKIMKDGIVPHFSDDASLGAYYAAKQLTKSDLQSKGLKAFKCPT